MSIIKTAGAGVATFFLCEGIVRIPFLEKSETYLPIPKKIICISTKLRIIQDIVESIFRKILQHLYTENFDFCVGTPITEEFGHRLLFQELFLKQGMKFGAAKLGLSYDPESRYSQIFRVGLSSLVFAAGHTWAFSRDRKVNPYGAASLVYLVAMGIILGTAQEKTGNTLHPIAIHMINNTMTCLFN
jgi:hypothetical protein